MLNHLQELPQQIEEESAAEKKRADLNPTIWKKSPQLHMGEEEENCTARIKQEYNNGAARYESEKQQVSDQNALKVKCRWATDRAPESKTNEDAKLLHSEAGNKEGQKGAKQEEDMKNDLWGTCVFK